MGRVGLYGDAGLLTMEQWEHFGSGGYIPDELRVCAVYGNSGWPGEHSHFGGRGFGFWRRRGATPPGGGVLRLSGYPRTHGLVSAVSTGDGCHPPGEQPRSDERHGG